MDRRHEEMLSKIRNGAIRAFGKDSAERWLDSRWRVFGDRTPREMARTENDAQRVLDYVGRLTAAEDALTNAGIRGSDH